MSEVPKKQSNTTNLVAVFKRFVLKHVLKNNAFKAYFILVIWMDLMCIVSEL